MAQRRKPRRKSRVTFKRILLALAAVPMAYLLAALVGSLIPLNTDWREPDEGVTVYLADNGVHVDLVLPVRAAGLDWAPFVPTSDLADAAPDLRWVAFGAGERRVYLDTPTWADLSARTVWAALTGGERIVHVEYVADPDYAARELRLTAAQYRRLWSAIRSEFRRDGAGQPIRIDHPGYGPRDAFYEGAGRASAISTCNNWIAGRLRLAGVTVSAWPPFSHGLMWRYRKAEQR